MYHILGNSARNFAHLQPYKSRSKPYPTLIQGCHPIGFLRIPCVSLDEDSDFSDVVFRNEDMSINEEMLDQLSLRLRESNNLQIIVKSPSNHC
jgi:hypothetical protein